MSSRTSAACGLVLLGLGLLLLLGTLGLMPVDWWRIILPVLLIALGIFTIWMVLTRGDQPATADVSVPLGQATTARFRFRFGAGRLRITGDASAGNLLELQARGGVRHSLRVQGAEADVRVWVPTEFLGDVLAPWRWGGTPPQWDARLRNDMPLHLDLEMGACEADIDLTNLIVPELRLATGASATVLRMPVAGGVTRARISAGAASVKVYIPPGIAARIVSEVGLGEVNVDRVRFPRGPGGYESTDYAASTNRVDLTVELGAASVEVM